MKKTEQKRFIAGAVCPDCGAVDTTRVYQSGDKQVRDCVNCEFQEQQVKATNSRQSAKIPTDITAEDIESIRLIEPDSQ